MHFKLIPFEDFLNFTKTYLPYFFVSLLVIETEYLLLQLHKYKKKETVVNLLTGGISILAQSFLKIFFFANIYPEVYSHRIFDIPLGWHQVVITLLLYTFLQWFIHMLAHKLRFFWCLHEVHHSATQMKCTTVPHK